MTKDLCNFLHLKTEKPQINKISCFGHDQSKSMEISTTMLELQLQDKSFVKRKFHVVNNLAPKMKLSTVDDNVRSLAHD
jgi:hypothetical protein